MIKKFTLYLGILSLLCVFVAMGLLSACNAEADISTPLKVFKLSFDPNGGDGTMEFQTIAAGATISLPTNSFTRNGHVFAGWGTTNDGPVQYADNEAYTMGQTDTMLYALWKIQITGTFDYPAITITYGQSKTSDKPSWNNASSGQTLDYTITPPSGGSMTGISINSDTGEVTVGADAPLQSGASYTVTATGMEDYIGSVSGSIVITVNPATVTGTFDYPAISITYGQSQTSDKPSWNNAPSGQTLSYTITPPSGGSMTGISINSDTGEVTVGADAPLQSGASYTVTATGTGGYSGTLTGSIGITVNHATVTGTFDYPAITIAYGQSQTSDKPSWNNAPSEQTLIYTITPPTDGSMTGISINSDTGEVTVGADAPLQSGTSYTVTATGTGGYTGTVTGSIVITVNHATVTGTFDYPAITITYGQSQTSNKPSWNNAPSGQTLSYTITPPSEGSMTGISINSDTGEVTVGADAPLQSSASYTVTATGTGDYTGSVTGSISITVNPPANAAPGAPIISSTTAEYRQVKIIWDAPTDMGYINNDGTKGVITKYKVYYSTMSGFDISDADGSRETTQPVCIISELTDGTAYYFKVTAFNDTGESLPSAADNATPVTFAQAHTQQTVTLADDSTTTVWTQNSDSNFVYVESGTFWMGAQSTDTTAQNYDEDAHSSALPVHQVTVSRFYISKYEVTQTQYNTVMGTNPSRFSGAKKPVERVSWYNAVAYCNQLSEVEGREKVYTINGTKVTADWTKNGYRLPTEAEWEYAARGARNSNGYKYSGSNTVDDVAWYLGNSQKITQEVGSKKPNELGLYDMCGNVLEWCWDWLGNYESEEQINPLGVESGLNRIVRGGSWIQETRLPSSRGGNKPDDESRSDIGFRIVFRAL